MPSGRLRSALGRPESYLSLLVLGSVAFTLGPSLVGSRVLASVNTLTRYLPWRADGLQIAGHQICTTDTIDSALPITAFIRNQLYAGHLGTWQNMIAGGSPMFSNPNAGLLDPLSWPLLILPLWLAPAVVVLAQLLASIVGMTLFLRLLGASRAAGILAGFVYATSGFMVMWTNWPQTRVAALIPLLLWAVERLVQRRRLLDTLPVGLVVAAMLFGGFPQVTGYALYLAGGYLLVRVLAVHRHRLRAALRPIGLALLGLLLGAGLSMVQMLPFLHDLSGTDLSARANTAGLPFSSLVTAAVPNAYGSCIYPSRARGGYSPVELIAYVGAAALVLAVAGAASGRTRPREGTRAVRGYLVAALLVVTLLGWVSLDLRELAQHLPIFSTTFIGRIRVILGFLFAVLAGLGFDAMLRGRGDRGGGEEPGAHRRPAPRLRGLLWPALVWAAAALGAVVVLREARHFAFAHGFSDALNNSLVTPLVLGGVAVLVYLLARTGRRWLRVLAALVVPALVVVQGTSFVHTILPGDSRANFYPVTPTHRFLLDHLGHDRYAALGTMMPSTSLYYGLRTPTGHAFHDPHWQRLLKVVDSRVMQAGTFSAFTASLTAEQIGSSPVLDRMAVKYFVLPPDQVAGTQEPAPAGNGALRVPAGSSATCTLPAQPLRGVQVTLADALQPLSTSAGTTLRLTVRDGARTLHSGRFLDGPVAAGAQVSIGVAGEDIRPGGVLTVSLSAEGARGPMAVRAVGAAMRCTPIGPAADGLKLVYADPASVIYQRLTALPRIRWAGSAEVLRDEASRLATLGTGAPAGTVVLSEPGPAGSGQPARVRIVEDSGSKIAARVSASGAGYLVVADAMQQAGWSVTVDGHPARLVAADAAMAAVHVPAGEHEVRFGYTAPGQHTGAAISGATVLVMLGMLLWEWRRRREGERDAIGDELPLQSEQAVDPQVAGPTR